MTEKVLVQIFIAMDENGDWTVGASALEASKALDAYEGKLRRIVVIDVQMSPPELVDGGEVVVPDEAGETRKVEASAENELPAASQASHHSG